MLIWRVPVSAVRGLSGFGVGRFAGVTEAVSPQKRCKSDAVSGHEEVKVLRFAKLTENATTPSRGSNRAAGFDLYSAYDYSIGPMDKALVKTDIQIAVPHGYYGRVAPRSGLAVKHFIDVGAGVVDEDYRGNLGVVLFNFNKEPFEVKKGERIAQLICERICYPELQELQVDAAVVNMLPSLVASAVLTSCFLVSDAG
uniref:Deoxyuridine 5'-triphosphate nucleotidohydrolase n=1 Tax=Cyprinus carpio TaxID=7962 RepID=A0A8C2G3W2_CYPCA